MREPWRIAGAALLLALALVGLVAWEGQARAAGREVALPMEAVDARELLTSRSLELRLGEILPEGSPCPPGTRDDAPTGPFDTRPRGWVALEPSGGGWRVSGLARRRADAARLGTVVVRGAASCERVGGLLIELDIGISRFHADQAEAKAVSAALSRPGASGRAYALVSVGRDGRARLNGVRVDGRRVELDWL